LIITLAFPTFDRAPDDDSPNALRSRNKRAMRYMAKGRADKAVPLYKQTVTDCKRVYGAYDPNTLRARNNLAMCYHAAGRTDEAILLLRQTLTSCKRVLGADNPDTRATRANLAAVRRQPQTSAANSSAAG
jgi:tetratricopeptide (TPR) repeat protein